MHFLKNNVYELFLIGDNSSLKFEINGKIDDLFNNILNNWD